MADWQVQEAKSRFSEVIERAEREGPQTITKHGKPKAVVLSTAEYDALRRPAQRRAKLRPDLVDILLNRGPKFDEFEIEPSGNFAREIDLE
jgi:prevent-host-death family protein